MSQGSGYASRSRTTWLGALLSVVVVAVSLSARGSPASPGASGPSTTAPQTNSVGGVVAGPPDTAPIDGGKVVYGIDAEPEGLNPVKYAFSQSGNAVASAVFEPLATLDADGRAVPYLATSFDHNAENTEWTIGLPTGVHFHDGTPMDADAVVTALAAYKTGAITGNAMFAFETFTRSDATHVVMKLNRPIADVPVLFTTQIGFIFAPSMLSADDELARKPVGTGAFMFSSHIAGQAWTFTKNPTYRRSGLPHLDGIDFLAVPDPSQRNSMLQSGDLDVIQTFTGTEINALRSSDFKRVENRHGDKTHLVLNTTTAPFDSVLARRAVAAATDSAAWRKAIGADVPIPANSPFSAGQPGHLVDNGYPTFDLEAAKRLVKQYELESGDPLEFTYLVVSDNTNMALGQQLVASYEQVGMKVTLDAKPQINLIAAVATGKYQLSGFRLYAHPSVDADFVWYRGESIGPAISVNFPRLKDDIVDTASDEAIATSDPVKKSAALEKVNRRMAEQVPVVWLGQNTWMLAASPRVNGIYTAANGTIATMGPKTWIAELSVAR